MSIHLLYTFFFVQNIEIFSTPLVDQYAFFGSDVTFHCAINVSGSRHNLDFIAYKENGVPQTVDKTGNITSAITGTFTLTQDNNGTRVRCRATVADLSTKNSSAFAYGQGTYNVSTILINFHGM